MATAENVALARRVARLERLLVEQSALWIRTTLVVCERDDEPEYTTTVEALRAAEDAPPVREVRRIPDLEALIDPVRRVKRLRNKLSPRGQARFDELKQRPGVRLIDIEIHCHEKQVGAILSDSPTVAGVGGNRGGKTRILDYWLLRRWLKRGHQQAVFWWVSPTTLKLIEQGVWELAGKDGLGGGVWPDEIFAELKHCPKTKKNPQLDLIDGSVVLFQHANHSGQSAAQNLKSANVTDAVADELGAIRDGANWHQLQIRVSQTGGSVAGSTTLVRGHWSHEDIIERAKEVGPDVIDLHEMDIFDNPWMSYAQIWRLFLNDKTLTPTQLERHVLPAEDKRAACLALRLPARSLREHFGIETMRTMNLWVSWRDELVYSSALTRHSEIVVSRDGKPVRLQNITAQVLARKWPEQAARGHRWSAWAGVDFNVRGHAAVLELFGEGPTLEDALAAPDTWTVLISDEVQVDGTTQELGLELRDRAGVVPVWYDPHGAPGHHARGTGTTTDAAILWQLGFPASPANGASITSGAPMQLSQIDSRNVMHALMEAGRLRVHERCTGFVRAMSAERRKPDGRVDKRSSPDSDSDFLSGFSDSARYGIWPIFRSMFAHHHHESED